MKYLVVFSIGCLAGLLIKPKKTTKPKSNIVIVDDRKSIADLLAGSEGEKVILSVLNKNKPKR